MCRPPQCPAGCSSACSNDGIRRRTTMDTGGHRDLHAPLRGKDQTVPSKHQIRYPRRTVRSIRSTSGIWPRWLATGSTCRREVPARAGRLAWQPERQPSPRTTADGHGLSGRGRARDLHRRTSTDVGGRTAGDLIIRRSKIDPRSTRREHPSMGPSAWAHPLRMIALGLRRSAGATPTRRPVVEGTSLFEPGQVGACTPCSLAPVRSAAVYPSLYPSRWMPVDTSGHGPTPQPR